MEQLELPAELFPQPVAMQSGLGPGVWHTAPDGRTFELRTLRFPVQGGGSCAVQIASDRTADEALLAGARRRVAMVLAAALIGCALLGLAMGRRGLRPVARIGATLRP